MLDSSRGNRDLHAFFSVHTENNEKSRQYAENKQTFDLTGKIEKGKKTCQTAENKQTCDFSGKIQIDGKSRQNAENKQTFHLRV